jgi:drug/metabolite transporter (DMT)-like permease
MPAIRYAGAARVGILIGMAPVFSAGLAILTLGEPLHAVLAIATVMIVVGGALLAWDPSRPEGFRRIGLVFGGIAAALFAGQAVVLRGASRGH